MKGQLSPMWSKSKSTNEGKKILCPMIRLNQLQYLLRFSTCKNKEIITAILQKTWYGSSHTAQEINTDLYLSLNLKSTPEQAKSQTFLSVRMEKNHVFASNSKKNIKSMTVEIIILHARIFKILQHNSKAFYEIVRKTLHCTILCEVDYIKII